MTVMIKSLARAKFVAPILSELSTMNARSRGAHLHSAHAHKTHTLTTFQKNRKTMEFFYDCVLNLAQTYHSKLDSVWKGMGKKHKVNVN